MFNEKQSAGGDTSDISHNELLDVLARLQGELEARDIVIATLQCEQRYLDIEEVKQNRYFLDQSFEIDESDAILALQRDETFLESPASDDVKDSQKKDVAVRNKKYQFDELLDAQRRLHGFYQKQIQILDQRYITLCNTFDEERKKLEKDAAQGDDVVVMLEKERERLKSELEYERAQNHRLEKELRKTENTVSEQSNVIQKQRMVAAHLIKGKRRLMHELSIKCQQVEHFECKQVLHSSVSPLEISAVSTSEDNTTPQLTAQTTVLQVDISTDEHLPGNRTSLSPPRPDSIESPSTTSTPSKPEMAGASSTVPLHFFRVNGCSSSSSVDSTLSSNETYPSKASSLTKPRPEPPVRRTPEYASPPVARSSLSSRGTNRPPSSSTLVDKLSSLGVLEIETNSFSSSENRASTPSPPPPPPPMQLQYPYPGMQGNAHHPPVQNLASPRNRHVIGATHHFPGSPTNRGRMPANNFVLSVKNQPPSNLRFAVDRNVGFGGRKTSPNSSGSPSQLQRVPPQVIMTSASSYPVSPTPARPQGPRVIVAGRGGNLYINGK